MRESIWSTLVPAVLISVAGAVFSADLLVRHFHGPSTGLISRFCTEQTMRCDEVLTSRWCVFPPALAKGPGDVEPRAGHDVLFRVPAASLGLAYFTTVALWLVLIGRPSWGRRWVHTFPTALVAFGCAASVAFLTLMGAVIQSWCIPCVVIHGLNFALFLFVCLARPVSPLESGTEPWEQMPHPTFRLTVAVLALAGCASVAIWLAGDRFELASNREASAAESRQPASNHAIAPRDVSSSE